MLTLGMRALGLMTSLALCVLFAAGAVRAADLKVLTVVIYKS